MTHVLTSVQGRYQLALPFWPSVWKQEYLGWTLAIRTGPCVEREWADKVEELSADWTERQTVAVGDRGTS